MRNQATTGLTEVQWEELAGMVAVLIPARSGRGRPAVLDDAARVRLTVEHLRSNDVQHALAEHYRVSQATVCRTIKVMLPLIDAALAGFDTGLVDVSAQETLMVDGTLIPTGRRAGQDRLYNGKYRIHGVNVQVVCTLDGLPVWASGPRPGADHDLVCFRAHGLCEVFDTRGGLADAGYQGHGTTGLITPVKRHPGWDLTADRKAFNREHAALRAPVERVNAWLKAFKILTTRYRRTWNDLELTIRAVFRILRYRQLTSLQPTYE